MVNDENKSYVQQLDEIINFFNSAVSSYIKANKSINISDNKQLNALHDIEFCSDLSDEEKIEIFDYIGDTRRARRMHKDDYDQLEIISNFIKKYSTLLDDLISCRQAVAMCAARIDTRVYFKKKTDDDDTFKMKYQPNASNIGKTLDIPKLVLDDPLIAGDITSNDQIVLAVTIDDVISQIKEKYSKAEIVKSANNLITIDIMLEDKIRLLKVQSIFNDILNIIKKSKAYARIESDLSGTFTYTRNTNRSILVGEIITFCYEAEKAEYVFNINLITMGKRDENGEPRYKPTSGQKSNKKKRR